MKTNEIRKKFLEFFKSKQHTIVESDSVVPKDDPTVLFTTAGMQQFKKQFLGNVDEYTRATTAQKCIRTDDLPEVGKTDFHHTFFEMLGNFSFGDYFKKEAITWGWEFLTKEMGIPPEKLWVSVYKDDKEALEIWKSEIKELDPKKIVKLGDKSNFWPANAKEDGPNGPCGPCSEIFYDYGPGPNGEGADCDPGTDDVGRFSEVWNLVFTQFNRKDGGELDPLPSKNIDTGMGLERLAAVVQGKSCNYETDIFAPILDAIDKNMTIDTSKQERNERYVIADHIRAVCFGINDGVIPSNEGRGYVIKRLIIDITDIVLQHGAKGPLIYKLVPSVVEAMGEAYPELSKKAKDIAAIIKNIEQSYIKVRKERLPEFEKQVKGKTDPKEIGETIFRFRDTYGLAINTIENILPSLDIDEKTLKKSWEEFEKFMQQQQEQSRASSKMTGDVFTESNLDLDVKKTEFIGYDETEAKAKVLRIFKDNESVKEAKEGDEVKIVLDKTPFYAESGGQIGDTGYLKDKAASVRINDTQKTNDIYIHTGTVEKGTLKVNAKIEASIDAERRLSIMRNHTATHLMQAAMREVLGSHVQQQGSLVAEDRLRFDFTHHQGITDEEVQQIENAVNAMVQKNTPVAKEFLSIEEARKRGALAFFAEKYGKIVRVVSIGEDSKEFCGGTHLDATGQIGLFKIVGESAIAQGIRRIEAKTGSGALEFINEKEKTLSKLAKLLKSPPSEIIDRIEKQAKKLKKIEKDYDVLKFEAIKTAIVAGLDNTEKLDGISVYSRTFTDIEMKMLRKISDFLKQKLPSSLIILGAKSTDGATILIESSKEAIEKGFKADEMIKEVADKIGGSGGGRPQLAQAGGKNAQKIDEAIEQLNQYVRKLNS